MQRKSSTEQKLVIMPLMKLIHHLVFLTPKHLVVKRKYDVRQWKKNTL